MWYLEKEEVVTNDSAWRYEVVKNLHNYSVRGNMLQFTKKFLAEEQLKVRIGNIMSRTVLYSEGIPQGSVLSCTCFMVAVNEIDNYLPRNINSALYVDEYIIYASGSVPHMIERRLQNAINRLLAGCNQTGFTFSNTKTVAMHVRRKRRCPKIAHNMTMYGTSIKYVENQ